MKVSVKTLKGNHFYIEVQPTDKVLNVKKQIEQLRGPQTYPTELQLLIHQGKVLKDENTIEEIKITANTFLVVMLSKTKAQTAGTSLTHQTAPSVSTPSEAQLPSSSSPTVGNGTTQTDANAYNQPSAPMATAQAGPNAVPLNLFPIFPTGATAADTAQAGHNAAQCLPKMRTGPAVLTDTQILVEFIDSLRNDPGFQALRSVLQSDPQQLQPLFLQLGRVFPLAQEFIENHLADILRVVREPVKGGCIINLLAGSLMQPTMNLSPEEHEAVERLEAMGFERARVIQAFLVCDKNEELARKYLLDQGGDHDDKEKEQ